MFEWFNKHKMFYKLLHQPLSLIFKEDFFPAALTINREPALCRLKKLKENDNISDSAIQHIVQNSQKTKLNHHQLTGKSIRDYVRVKKRGDAKQIWATSFHFQIFLSELSLM